MTKHLIIAILGICLAKGPAHGQVRLQVDGDLQGSGDLILTGTSPGGSRLQVVGGVLARGGAPGAFGAANNGYAFSNGGDNDSGLFSTANGLVQLYTDSQERLRINSGGNVGIGLSSPTSRLSVNGNIDLSATSQHYRIGGVPVLARPGLRNIFVGNGGQNNTGQQNTIVGAEAGVNHTSGTRNVYVGDAAGNQASNSRNNTFVGALAGLNAQSSGSLVPNDNAFFGAGAGQNTTTGSGNTFLGFVAGNNNTTGSFNTAVGYNASALIRVNNSTAIGAFSTALVDHRVILGNSAIADIRGYVNVSSMSDKRFKQNIRRNVKGLEFIMELQPVTYQIDTRKLDRFLHPDALAVASAGTGLDAADREKNRPYQEALREKAQHTYTGFVAQEVEAAARQVDYDFSGVVRPAGEHDHYSLRYAEFVVPLVKAVQEQQAIIAEQEALIERQQVQIAALQAGQAGLQERLNRIERLLRETGSDSVAPAIPPAAARLDQNQPNPFGQTTVIPYFIPHQVRRAELQLVDAAGKLLWEIPITQRGEGRQELQTAHLSPGTYFYTLLLDGQLLTTRQMIVAGK